MPSASLMKRTFQLNAGAAIQIETTIREEERPDPKKEKQKKGSPLSLGGGHPYISSLEIIEDKIQHLVKVQFERYEFPTSIILRVVVGRPEENLDICRTLQTILNAHTSHCNFTTAAAFPSSQKAEKQQKKKKIKGNGEATEKNKEVSTKIIFSEFGSPYACHYKDWQVKEISSHEIEETVDHHGHVDVKASSASSKNKIKITAPPLYFLATSLGVAVRRRDLPTKSQLAKEKEPEPPRKELLPTGARVMRSHFNTGTCDLCQQPIEVGRFIVQESRGSWAHAACVADQTLKKHPKEKSEDESKEGSAAKKKRKRSNSPMERRQRC